MEADNEPQAPVVDRIGDLSDIFENRQEEEGEGEGENNNNNAERSDEENETMDDNPVGGGGVYGNRAGRTVIGSEKLRDILSRAKGTTRMATKFDDNNNPIRNNYYNRGGYNGYNRNYGRNYYNNGGRNYYNNNYRRNYSYKGTYNNNYYRRGNGYGYGYGYRRPYYKKNKIRNPRAPPTLITVDLELQELSNAPLTLGNPGAIRNNNNRTIMTANYNFVPKYIKEVRKLRKHFKFMRVTFVTIYIEPVVIGKGPIGELFSSPDFSTLAISPGSGYEPRSLAEFKRIYKGAYLKHDIKSLTRTMFKPKIMVPVLSLAPLDSQVTFVKKEKSKRKVLKKNISRKRKLDPQGNRVDYEKEEVTEDEEDITDSDSDSGPEIPLGPLSTSKMDELEESDEDGDNKMDDQYRVYPNTGTATRTNAETGQQVRADFGQTGLVSNNEFNFGLEPQYAKYLNCSPGKFDATATPHVGISLFWQTTRNAEEQRLVTDPATANKYTTRVKVYATVGIAFSNTIS